MNKKIKKYIYNIKKYSWIIMLIYIYLFTSLISSISEKTLEFRNVSINAEKMSYFSSNNTSSNKSTNNNNSNSNLQMILIKIRKKRRIRKKNKKI